MCFHGLVCVLRESWTCFLFCQLLLYVRGMCLYVGRWLGMGRAVVADRLLRPTDVIMIKTSGGMRGPKKTVLGGLLDNKCANRLHTIGPGRARIRNITTFTSIGSVPSASLTVLTVPTTLYPSTIRVLTTRGRIGTFVVLSTNFNRRARRNTILRSHVLRAIGQCKTSLVNPGYVNFVGS